MLKIMNLVFFVFVSRAVFLHIIIFVGSFLLIYDMKITNEEEILCEKLGNSRHFMISPRYLIYFIKSKINFLHLLKSFAFFYLCPH